MATSARVQPGRRVCRRPVMAMFSLIEGVDERRVVHQLRALEACEHQRAGSAPGPGERQRRVATTWRSTLLRGARRRRGIGRQERRSSAARGAARGDRGANGGSTISSAGASAVARDVERAIGESRWNDAGEEFGHLLPATRPRHRRLAAWAVLQASTPSGDASTALPPSRRRKSRRSVMGVPWTRKRRSRASSRDGSCTTRSRRGDR